MSSHQLALCVGCRRPHFNCQCIDPPTVERIEPTAAAARDGYKIRPAGIRGVYESNAGRYFVRVRWKGELFHLGTFDSTAEANAARERFYLPRLGIFWQFILASNVQYATNTAKRKRRRSTASREVVEPAEVSPMPDLFTAASIA